MTTRQLVDVIRGKTIRDAEIYKADHEPNDLKLWFTDGSAMTVTSGDDADVEVLVWPAPNPNSNG